MNRLSYMDQNFEDINTRIREAEKRVGREGVRLVAAVKYTDAEHINKLFRLFWCAHRPKTRTHTASHYYKMIVIHKRQFLQK